MVVKKRLLTWLWFSACMAAFATSLAVAAPTNLPSGDLHDDESNRTTVRALLDEFNTRLLASTSATLTLESWCAEHHLATNPKIVARVEDAPVKPASSKQRKRLKVGRGEPIRFRHVALTCGDIVLAQADIWYIPSRLTAEMNQQLNTSDIPFGRVIRPLSPNRKTFSARILWPRPGHQSRKHSAATALSLPAHVIRHRALVLDGKGCRLPKSPKTTRGRLLPCPMLRKTGHPLLKHQNQTRLTT